LQFHAQGLLFGNDRGHEGTGMQQHEFKIQEAQPQPDPFTLFPGPGIAADIEQYSIQVEAGQGGAQCTCPESQGMRCLIAVHNYVWFLSLFLGSAGL
jgi:hypothetical protein